MIFKLSVELFFMEEIRTDISETMLLSFSEISPNPSFLIRSILCVKSPFAKESKHMLILVSAHPEIALLTSLRSLAQAHSFNLRAIP